MSKSFAEVAAVEVGKLLSPLERLDGDGPAIIRFINALGWDLGDGSEINLSNAADIPGLVTNIVEAADEQTASIAVQSLIDKIPSAINDVRVAAPTIAKRIKDIKDYGSTGTPGDDVADIAKLVARRIVDYLLYEYLLRNHPRIYAVSHVLGIAEIVIDAADTPNMPIRTIHWSRISTLLTNPKEIAKRVYQWDSDPVTVFDGEEFLTRMEVLLRAFMIPGGIYRQSETIRTQLNRPAGEDSEIRIPLYQAGIWPEAYSELDLNLSPVHKPDGSNKGLFLYPYFTAGLDLDADLSDGWSIESKGNFTSNSELGVEIWPPADLDIRTGIFGGNDLEDIQFELGLTKKSPNEELNLIFGQPDASRFGYLDFGIKAFLGLESGAFTFALEAMINELTLVINVAEGDGFIREILAGFVLESISDLTVGISNKEGFYFKGSSALAITIPIHEELGPLFLDSVKIGVGFIGEIKVILAVTFSLELGPITGSVKNIGLEIPMSFPDDNSGKYGPIDIDGVKFLKPSGVGLALNAVVTGGGFLERDGATYAGILALGFGNFSLTAIGLITTEMPDGSDGFSLLAIVSVIFATPIQLVMGITLNGVGGILGLDRTINTDFLREGLRARTLGSILFPEDPIKNAPKIISDVGNAFPVHPGRFVFGPCAKLGWGGGIVTADICILVDVPAPFRVILLGQLNAKLPKPKSGKQANEKERTVVNLNLDVLGELDFAKKTFSLDATLYDSTILVLILYGDAAVRVSWGDNPYLVLSIGGFHPGFTPPPGFPILRRITVTLADSAKFTARLELYHAITSSALMVGSDLQLKGRFAGIKLKGHITFDAILYYDPFSFIAQISAGIAVKFEGRSLGGVALSGRISGPTPWYIRGKASFEIFIWELKVDFEKSFGDPNVRTLDEENPLIPLQAELNQDSSWGVVFVGTRNYESFFTRVDDGNGSAAAAGDTPEEDVLLMHPAGMLEIREKILPLNHELDLYSNARVKCYKKFCISEIKITSPSGSSGGNTQIFTTEYINEKFAVAQYFLKTDDEKMSNPSFESMPGGVVPQKLAVKRPDQSNYKAAEFENVLIDEDRVSMKSTESSPYSWNRTLDAINLDKSAMMIGNQKFVSPGMATQFSVADETFHIVNSETLEPIALSENSGNSFTMTNQILKDHLAGNPEEAGNLQIVPSHEAEVA